MRATTPWPTELLEMLQSGADCPGMEPGALDLVGQWARRWGLQFHFHALLHPINLTLLLLVGCGALVGGAPWAVPLALGADFIAVHGVTRSAAFRRVVFEGLERADHALMRRRLNALLSGLSDDHRDQFDELLRLHRALNGADGTTSRFIADRLEPTRLLAHYLRLALMHHQWSKTRTQIDRSQLGQKLEQLEAELADLSSVGASPGLRQVLEQRRSVLAARAEHWDRTEERLQIIDHQLEVIVEIVELLQAHAATVASPEEAEEAIAVCIEKLEQHEPTIRRLAELEELPLPGPELPVTAEPQLLPAPGSEEEQDERQLGVRLN